MGKTAMGITRRESFLLSPQSGPSEPRCTTHYAVTERSHNIGSYKFSRVSSFVRFPDIGENGENAGAKMQKKSTKKSVPTMNAPLLCAVRECSHNLSRLILHFPLLQELVAGSARSIFRRQLFATSYKIEVWESSRIPVLCLISANLFWLVLRSSFCLVIDHWSTYPCVYSLRLFKILYK